MKNILLTIIVVCSPFWTFSQTIVSTTPENKNVVLEEFTGIHCVHCPDGHAKAKAIQDANPDDVVLINIHVGYYATPNTGEPDFRTSFGSSIEGQSDIGGYPAGTINRHFFSTYTMEGGTAIDRFDWQNAANTILGQSSYVNVAIEASIDYQTRELSVHVEAYYTGNSPKSTNKLNVVLLQNNTKGPQTGGNMGNDYVHMHRLVHMITGQWGEDITSTTTGSFIDKIYTYAIPEDYNDIEVLLEDMEVAAFIAEGQQEIITGARVYPQFTNLLSTNANLAELMVADKICGNSIQPTIKIKNKGSNSITKCSIAYSINEGTESTFNWTGDLLSLKAEEIVLDDYAFDPQQTNTIDVSIVSVNDISDDDEADNSLNTNFSKAKEADPHVTLTLKSDGYGSEIRWKLYNASGIIVDQGGPYSNNTTITKNFELDSECHLFKITDSYGDGGAIYSLKDSENITIHSSDGNYGSGEDVPFSATLPLAVNKLEMDSYFSIYPNPSKGEINISFSTNSSENITLKVFDNSGKLIKSEAKGVYHPGSHQINHQNNLKPGVYHIELSGKSYVKKQKIVIVN